MDWYIGCIFGMIFVYLLFVLMFWLQNVLNVMGWWRNFMDLYGIDAYEREIAEVRKQRDKAEHRVWGIEHYQTEWRKPQGYCGDKVDKIKEEANEYRHKGDS